MQQRLYNMAAKEGESRTEAALRHILSQEEFVSLEAIEQLIENGNKIPAITDIAVDEVSLESYDELLTTGKEAVIYG